jgi:hypothetical protein
MSSSFLCCVSPFAFGLHTTNRTVRFLEEEVIFYKVLDQLGHYCCESVDEGSYTIFKIIKEIGKERSYIG